MKFIFFNLLFLFSLWTGVFAQNGSGNQANIWYFGRYAGIDFNTQPPTPLMDGEINNWEGCAALSDEAGQLLIYTNGISIWNRQHEIMPGADNLGGHNSATQSGVIIPKPESPNLVYVFSVDEELSDGGIRYAEIDMNLNGGLGGVISTNNVLFSPVSEKLTAVRHCNEVDYWIIAHGVNNNHFLVWSLSSTGISANPIVHQVGSVHSANSIGYSKSSADGSRLAVCVEEGSLPDFAEVVDFNNDTGEISNARRFGEELLVNAYGLEFSPNGKLLYAAGTQNFPELYQFDLTLPTGQAIHDAAILIAEGTSNYFGALQNAPDGKIYVAKDEGTALSVIHQPNERGLACNFVEDDFFLGGRDCRLGLPNYVASFFRQEVGIDLQANLGTCNETNTLSAVIPEICYPTSFQWFLDGVLLENENNLTLEINEEGMYSFQFMVDYNCNPETYTEMIDIAFSLPLTIENVDISPVDCQSNTGSISITATGGTSPYQYSFDNGTMFQNGNSLENLPTGNYTIVVQDANGCEINQAVNLAGDDAPTISDIQVTPSSCGENNGSISIAATGGTSPYQYSFDNGTMFQNENILENLPTGDYTIVVQDANGCEINQAVNVIGNNAPTISDIQITPSSCGENNGSISITATGGTSPYQYSFDNGTMFQNENILENLPTGDYTIVVQDANGCEINQAVNVTGNDAPTISDIQVTPSSCDENNGSISIVATGGTSPYQYSFDNGVTFQNENILENLPTGNYTIVVQDVDGCAVNQAVNLAGDDAPTISDIQVTPSSCGENNGSISITATSGTSPYQYSFDNGVTFQNENNLENLPTGNYTIVVQDVDGCAVNQAVNLAGDDAPTISDIQVTPSSCGENNASISVIVANGTAPYQYSFDNGATFQNENTLENLPAGEYIILVQDNTACEVNQIVTLDASTAPEIMEIQTIPTTCGENNGSISITATGGTSPYQYSFDNGTTFQNENILGNLPASNYTIIVQDANNCTIIQSLEIEASTSVNIIDIQSTDAFCNMENGTINISEVEGVPPFEYSINGQNFQTNPVFNNLNSGFHTISIQDAQGCMITTQILVADTNAPSMDILQTTPVTCGEINGSLEVSSTDNTSIFEYSLDGINFQNSGLFENLPADIYTVIMQNTMGCMNEISVEITALAPPMIATINANPANCESDNGSIEITVNGGSNVTYSIDGLSFQNENIFENLAADTYTIQIQDDNNCTASQTTEIEEDAPPSIESIDIIPSSCGEDNAALTVTGSHNSSSLEYSLDGTIFQPSPTFSNLSAGNYTVYLSDDNECTVTETISIEGNDTPLLIQNVRTTPAFCGENNGSLNFDISGGTGDFSIVLNDSLSQSNTDFSNLSTGTYQVLVMDELGCETSSSAIVAAQECPIYIPSAFSPNGDDSNDVFRIYPHDEFKGTFRSFHVLDRWGETVFQTKNFEAKEGAWDGTFKGKRLNTQVFAYVVEVEFSNGQTEIYTGDVTLVE